ncbi:PadR family transcriptional regulator [Altererythrobacter sp. BO-6]|uniref:PadR family transcriptional regulator n=1 Tax=Altererythrobacter sp. BO-6 TaxID=2604537 RepID=UPI0019CFC395|nr:PadR family transcriptional regulator [Altererythrobacter sp. BO-6]
MSLRHVILSVLAEGPATGYDIARAFEQSLRHFWNASHQQIYRDLAALAAAGLVEFEIVAQNDRPNRKLYRISAQGIAELDRWTREPATPRVNSELLVKLNAAAAFGPERIASLLSGQRQIHEARLQAYHEIVEGLPVDLNEIDIGLADRTRLMALRRGIRGEEDWIGWIDESLDSLKSISPKTA